MRIRWARSLTLALAFLIAACAPSATPTPQVIVETVEVPVEVVVPAVPVDLTDILFRQAWLPDDLYVPYMVALDRGYYEGAGIRFINQIGSGAGTSTKVVASGAVPIGKGAASVVVQAIAEGLPITIILTEHQSDPGAVCSLPAAGIETGKDLEGISITTSPGDAGQPVLVAAMRNAGLDADSLNWVLMDPNLWITALLDGDVDAIGCYISNQPVDLAAQGVDVNVLTVADLGLFLPGQVVFVNNDFLAENPQVVRGFLEGTLLGYKDAVENPEQAAEIMAKYYPEVEAAVIQAKWDIIQRVWYSPATDEHGFGWNDPAAYENLQNLLMETGLLTQAVDFGSALNNEILEQIDLELRTIE